MVGIVRLLVGEKHRNVSEQGNMERMRNQGQGPAELGSLRQRLGRARLVTGPQTLGQRQGNTKLPADLRWPVLGDTRSIFQGYREREIIKLSYQGFQETVGVI